MSVFTNVELENAVTFGNVRSFYDTNPTMDDSLSSSSSSCNDSTSSSNNESPTNASFALSNHQRARALEADPTFPEKCRAFRAKSEQHAKIFFSWMEGNKADDLATDVGLSPLQLAEEVTLGREKDGRYIRRKRIIDANGVLSDVGNTSRARRRLKMKKEAQSQSWCGDERDENDNNWHKEVAEMARSMVLNSSALTTTDHHSSLLSLRRSSSTTNKTTRKTTPKAVRTMIKVATPKKLSKHRRDAFVEALVEFGVETFDDLKQFTYSELRNESCLQVFTGPQLKRMLTHCSASASNKQSSSTVHCERQSQRSGSKSRERKTKRNKQNKNKQPLTPQHDVSSSALVLKKKKKKPLTPINEPTKITAEEEVKKLSELIRALKGGHSLSKRGVQKFDIRRNRDEELDSDDEEEEEEEDEDSVDAVDSPALDSEMSELEISSFPTEEELENMESTASNTSPNKKREADNLAQEEVHDAITVEQQSSPKNIKKKILSKKTIKWSFVAGFFTAFATGAMIIWMAGSSDEKEVTSMPDDEGEQ